MSKEILYLFFGQVQNISFTKDNIESIYKLTNIQPYNLKKILFVYEIKPFSILIKKLHMKFILKTPLSNYVIWQLV